VTQPESPQLTWQQAHRKEYEETNGEKGHIWRGVPTLLLTTVGRHSGQLYTTPLIYGRDGGKYLVVASNGGAKKHPAWYINLADQPVVRVQVLGEKFLARALTATPEEKPPLWEIMTSIWPAYNDYQKKTTRDIPLVVIERIVTA
jgi:deazaflavin-dependent oxidoreductase (nitroreductase family)